MMNIGCHLLSDLAHHPWTSDHTPAKFKVWQQYQCNEEIINEVALRIITWNKMNQAHSVEQCHSKQKYPNNPWNCSEDTKSYIFRVEFQYQLILNCILFYQNENQPLDFILLQEVNDLVFELCSDRTSLRTQVSLFKKGLNDVGWGFISTEKWHRTRPMVVLYNATRFDFQNESRGMILSNRKNTLIEVLFKDHENSDSNLAISCCHFGFDKELQNKIVEYQQSQIDKNIFTVIAGDTNHTPFELPMFVGNTSCPTNLGLDGFSALTLFHNNTDQFRRYDNLAASPAKDKRVLIIEERCGLFTLPTTTLFQIRFITFSSEKKLCVSEWNRPWSLEEQNALPT